MECPKQLQADEHEVPTKPKWHWQTFGWTQTPLMQPLGQEGAQKPFLKRRVSRVSNIQKTNQSILLFAVSILALALEAVLFIDASFHTQVAVMMSILAFVLRRTRDTVPESIANRDHGTIWSSIARYIAQDASVRLPRRIRRRAPSVAASDVGIG